MVRLKKDGAGGYINRDTGEPVGAEIWKPIIEKARSDGHAAHVSRPKAPPKPRAVVPKKDGSGGYVDRVTGRQLNAAEFMPIISRQRAFGNIGANKKNIQQSLKTIQEDYGISEAEAKERYARFVAACDRYGKDSKGRYKADFGEYMYGEVET